MFYDQLSVSSVTELRQLASELAMQAIQALNRRAIELERDDLAQGRPGEYRINFGAYFYHGPREEALGESGAPFYGTSHGDDGDDDEAA